MENIRKAKGMKLLHQRKVKRVSRVVKLRQPLMVIKQRQRELRVRKKIVMIKSLLKKNLLKKKNNQ